MPAPVLLVSLGQSPAIVPEAFLLEGVRFGAVHVLTSESTAVDLIREFFATEAPGVRLTVSRVAGFHDLRGEADQARFEEVLYRWFLASAPDPSLRYVCVAGGFKTMSSAMQKAASLLGAAEVFHVLADPAMTGADGRARPPSSIPGIIAAARHNQIHWIRLGGESGWPQLRAATADHYPLSIETEDTGIRRVSAPNQLFRQHIREVIDRSHCIAARWDRIPDLPFPELATWPEAHLAWLEEALDPASATDREWVRRLPKLDLHCHLGGFATSGDLLDRVRSAGAESQLPPLRSLDPEPGWPLPAQPIGLERYRSLGDNNGSALLRDPACLRRQCELLYQELLANHTRYAEIRCSPANYASPELRRSPWDVLTDIQRAFDDCMRQARPDAGQRPQASPACQVNLIVIGTRQASGDCRAGIARHLALAVTAAEHWRDPTGCQVVGVDLAGYEVPETRAHYFREEFTAVHRCGLALTVHAGENDDAEGIWRAVFDLNARRLGHGLTLRQSPELLRSVADRGIAVEMCPYANLQIRGFPLDSHAERAAPADRYPLLDYLRTGLRVTVNTDNIGISAASLTDNLILAARLCPGLTRLDMIRLQRHALDAAFVSPGRRSTLARQLSAALPRP